MPIYKIWNGPAPTTAAQVAVTTGATIKTMLQLKLKAGVRGKAKAWGISFKGFALAEPIRCELLETGTVFATVTAYVAADIHEQSHAAESDPTTAYVEVGTAASGYTGSAEGTITATRMMDVQFVSPMDKYAWQWPLGTEPGLDAATATRIRVTAPAAVDCYCWLEFEV